MSALPPSDQFAALWRRADAADRRDRRHDVLVRAAERIANVIVFGAIGFAGFVIALQIGRALLHAVGAVALGYALVATIAAALVTAFVTILFWGRSK